MFYNLTFDTFISKNLIRNNFKVIIKEKHFVRYTISKYMECLAFMMPKKVIFFYKYKHKMYF